MSLYDVNTQELNTVINAEIDKMVQQAGKDFNLQSQQDVIEGASNPIAGAAIMKGAKASDYDGVGFRTDKQEFISERFDDIREGTSAIITKAITDAKAENPTSTSDLEEKVRQNIEQEFYNPTLSSTHELRKSVDFIQNMTGQTVDIKGYIQSEEGIGGWINTEAAQTTLAAAQQPAADTPQQEATPEPANDNNSAAEETPQQPAQEVADNSAADNPAPKPNPNRTRQRENAPEAQKQDNNQPAETSQEPAAPEAEAPEPEVTQQTSTQTANNSPEADAPEADVSEPDDAENQPANQGMQDQIAQYLENPIGMLNDEQGRQYLELIGLTLSAPLGSDKEENELKAEFAPMLAEVLETEDRRPGKKSPEAYQAAAEEAFDAIRSYLGSDDVQNFLNDPDVTVHQIEGVSRNAAVAVRHKLENSTNPDVQEFANLNWFENLFAGGTTPAQVLSGVDASGKIKDYTGKDLQTIMFAGLAANYVQSDTEKGKLETYDVDAEARMAERKRKEDEENKNKGLSGVADRVKDGGGDFLGVALPTGLTRIWEGISDLFMGLFQMIATLFEDRSEETEVAEETSNRRNRPGYNNPERTRDEERTSTISRSDQEKVEAIRGDNTSVRGGEDSEIYSPAGGAAAQRDTNPYSLHQ